MKPSSQVRVAVEFACEDTRTHPGQCPGCGHRIDPVNRLCPSCRLWLLPLPAARPRQAELTRAAGIAVLVLGSVLLGLVLYVLFSNEPRHVVVPATVTSSAVPR